MCFFSHQDSAALRAWGEPDISPFTNAQGLGTWRLESVPGWSMRVLPDIAIWELDGLSRVGLARQIAQSGGSSEKVHRPPGGTLVSPAGSHNLVGAVSFGQAMLVAIWPFFLERAVWEIGPLPGTEARLFFFLYWFILIMVSQGVSPDTSPHRKSGLRWPRRFFDHKLNKNRRGFEQHVRDQRKDLLS